MKNPKIPFAIGIVLCLPAVAIFVMMIFGMEPPLDPLFSYAGENMDGINILGTILSGLFFVVFPLVAFCINHFGQGRAPMNRKISAFALGIVVATITAFVVDQFPCWMGSPNCD